MARKRGDKIYIINNGVGVISGIIINISREFCTIILEQGGTTRLRNNRIFDTKEEAEKELIKYKKRMGIDYSPNATRKNIPYDYDY